MRITFAKDKSQKALKGLVQEFCQTQNLVFGCLSNLQVKQSFYKGRENQMGSFFGEISMFLVRKKFDFR